MNIDMPEIKSTVTLMPESCCVLIVHSTTYENMPELFVYHYQEQTPSEDVMRILREDANIKFQLKVGNMSAGTEVG